MTFSFFLLTSSCDWLINALVLSKKEFKDLARLARLDPDDESFENLLEDFNRIIRYVEKINEIKHNAGDSPSDIYTTIELRNVMREDKTGEVLNTDQLSEMAPQWEDGHFVVPGVIESV